MRSLLPSNPIFVSRFLRVMALAAFVLAFSTVAASGDLHISQNETDDEKTTAQEVVVEEVEDTGDGVTMAIDLEEGGVIDLDMTRGDLVIDTWEGDEVLVIVDKRTRSGAHVHSPKPISFKVSRIGNNVRIAALDEQGRRVTDLDFSFRIMVPKDRYGNYGAKDTGRAYDLAKLTSVVFKALHREALNWLTR